MPEKTALTETTNTAANAPSNIFSEFFSSAYQAGIERPVSGIKQLVGMGDPTPQPEQELHGAMKIAHMAGNAAGSIADFVVLSKVIGAGVGKLAGSTAASSEIGALLTKNATAQALTTAGLTGFVNGSLFTPVAQGESQWRRLGQGTVDASSFVAMTGIGIAMAPHVSNNLLGRVSVEAASGAGAGLVNTNLDAWTHGHLAGVKDNLSGASSWALANVVFGETSHYAGKGLQAASHYAGFDDPVRAIAPVPQTPTDQPPTPTAKIAPESAATGAQDASPEAGKIAVAPEDPTDPNRPPKIWTILSIDGGGIHGAIPAEVLARLEAKTGLHTTQMFDFITGTSTGGILANGLTVPDVNGNPKYNASDMVNLYEQEGQSIFTTNPLRIAKNWIFGGAKYSGEGLDNALDKYFGNQTLFKDHIGNVMVPTYETTSRQPWFFKNWDPNDGQMLARDVARATSAAPTFFPPLKFDYPLGDAPIHNGAVIDGGVAANNPAAAALAEAVRMSKPGDEFMVVSLGDGKLSQPFGYDQLVKARPFQWLQPIINIYGDGSPQVADYEVNQVMKLAPTEMQAKIANSLGYFRFNTSLTKATEPIDNGSLSNVQALKAMGDRIVDTEQPDQFNEMAAKLMQIRQQKLASGDYSNPVPPPVRPPVVTPTDTTKSTSTKAPSSAAAAVMGWFHRKDAT